MWRERIGWRALGTSVAIVVASLAITTAAVYLVQELGGIADASMLYLLAVALVAYLRGSWAAVATAIGAFLTYNFLFLPPRFTFLVADPQHILTLILLLTVGAGIGRLTGLQRDQAERSERREHEALALFGVSRAITSAKRMQDALPILVAGLAADTRMTRVWIGLGQIWAQEQVVATSDPTAEAPGSGPHSILPRRGPATGSRRGCASALQARRCHAARTWPSTGSSWPMGRETIGSLWAARDPRLGRRPRGDAAAGGRGRPDRAGDHARPPVGAGHRARGRRRSEELKAALLDSVSHDLRTPLSTIRATAGTLADPSCELDAGRGAGHGMEIDAEAERLADLLSGLLDMSRSKAAACDPRARADAGQRDVEPAVRRARSALARDRSR